LLEEREPGIGHRALDGPTSALAGMVMTYLPPDESCTPTCKKLRTASRNQIGVIHIYDSITVIEKRQVARPGFIEVQ
jgi:hypothetical protein